MRALIGAVIGGVFLMLLVGVVAGMLSEAVALYPPALVHWAVDLMGVALVVALATGAQRTLCVKMAAALASILVMSAWAPGLAAEGSAVVVEALFVGAASLALALVPPVVLALVVRAATGAAGKQTS